ncbi:hypothetical protein AB9K41_23165 [Cribrihabitans sp. XS_ASV171]
MTEREKIDALEYKLADALNLTAALQLVAWDMSQEIVEQDSQARVRRDAVIGLADALERALA